MLDIIIGELNKKITVYFFNITYLVISEVIVFNQIVCIVKITSIITKK
jgi:hypothetical protein